VAGRGATRTVSGRSHIAARVAVVGAARPVGAVAFRQRLVGRVVAAAAGGAVDGLVGLEGGQRVTWNMPQTKKRSGGCFLPMIFINPTHDFQNPAQRSVIG